MATGELIDAGSAHGQTALGASSPYGITSRKLCMWLFIASDAMTFGALMVAYGYLRVGSAQWPRPFDFSPSILNATVMTFVLLTSSLTMAMAVRAAKRSNRRGAVQWLLATLVLGISFVVLHLREWAGLYHEGARLFENPWGTPIFGAAFFSLTGLHILHVSAGVIYLTCVAIGVGRGTTNSDDVEISGIYWCFVDLVWMFVFPLVYLMSIRFA
jgi:cytochrome c oxidase subunit III